MDAMMLRSDRRKASEPQPEQQAATRPHLWLDLTHLGSKQREFKCQRCEQEASMPLGVKPEEDGWPPEMEGNCPKWQAE